MAGFDTRDKELEELAGREGSELGGGGISSDDAGVS